jgi:hypothetical protein
MVLRLLGASAVAFFVPGAESAVVDDGLEIVLRASGASEEAPHGRGNVYAPEVRHDDGRYRMWYGGQGKDGHDRIHLAESLDGRRWERLGVVLDDPEANHVNDPSVVRVDGTYFLYYTRADAGIRDEIALATSKDGVRWEPRGIVLRPGEDEDAWDVLLVGRPSVLHDGERFRMWYDGRKDLPEGPLAGDAPTSTNSRRFVGLATSIDGLRWTKHGGNPVFGDDAGGIDVKRLGDRFVMLYESRDGTKAAVSDDGIEWQGRGLVLPISGGEADAFGHVTPKLSIGPDGEPEAVYIGAASAPSWDRNAIGRIGLGPDRARELFGDGP